MPLPEMPKADDINPDDVDFTYDADIDTFIVHLFGRSRQAVCLDIDERMYLRLDPRTREVVGVQYENFLSKVVPGHPELLAIAEMAGIAPDVVEAVRRKISPRVLKQAAVRSVLDSAVASSTAD